MKTRCTVLFSGRVQGVGFRATTCQIAAGFQVTGFVRNLEDGRVELVAEGEAGELARFGTAIQLRMKPCIAGFNQVQSPATGEFYDFRTRY